MISALVAGAYRSLVDSGVKEENIVIQDVPGSYELPFAVQRSITILATCLTHINLWVSFQSLHIIAIRGLKQSSWTHISGWGSAVVRFVDRPCLLPTSFFQFFQCTSEDTVFGDHCNRRTYKRGDHALRIHC